MQVRHRSQRVSLSAGVLELAVNTAQVTEVLHSGCRCGQRCRLVQHLIAKEAVDTLVQALAILQGPQQGEGFVIVDAQLAAEPFGKGLVDVKSLGPGQGCMQGRRRKASTAVVLQCLDVQFGIEDDIVFANLAFQPIGGQVKECGDRDNPSQAVLEDQGNRRPSGAGALVHHAVGRLDLASAHIAEGGAPVLAVGGLVG